ncbi:MAG: helix-turn-helix domain-containing protein [Bacilli bacterium]|nr:helix-turn-helix domain-containing protein [Bacilli bacterium]
MTQTTDLALRAGQNLKRLLEEKGWSQEYAEERISNTFNNGRSIRRYIKNGINKLDTIQYIARIFEVDVMEFFK